MIVAPARFGSRRICSATANPSMSGISASINTSGNFCPALLESCIVARAIRPFSTAVGHICQCESISTSMPRFVALSSTISTGRPRRLVDGWRLARADGFCESENRMVKWNVLPRLGSLSTQIRPPISSTNCDEIVSPNPVPPNFRVVDPSACSNGRKMSCNLSAGMPTPVSVTVKCSSTSSVPRDSVRTRTTTSPSSVNLIALPARFITTCRNRPGSPISMSGTSGEMCPTSSSPF